MYRVLSRVALPFVWVRLWIRGRREPAYRERRRERMGFVAESIPRKGVWFHTVSAGETLGAIPLIRAVKKMTPDVPVLVTTPPPSGSDEVKKHLGLEVAHCYCLWNRSCGRTLFASVDDETFRSISLTHGFLNVRPWVIDV